jgi:hypothetical protein
LLATVLLPSLNSGTAAVCFHKDRKVSLATVRLKIYVNNGIKMSEQPLIINDADFSGRDRCHR